jgi:hypothetical protein
MICQLCIWFGFQFRIYSTASLGELKLAKAWKVPLLNLLTLKLLFLFVIFFVLVLSSWLVVILTLSHVDSAMQGYFPVFSKENPESLPRL